MIVPFEPYHLMSLVLRMHDDDTRELKAFGIGTDSLSRQRWACQSSLEILGGMTAMNSAQRPLAVLGVRQGASSRVGVLTLVTSPGWARYLKEGLYAWRTFLKGMPFSRLEATVMPDVNRAIPFIERMGFTRDCPLPSVREDGGDLFLYSMRCPHG